jgi:hypothetical protein
MSDPKRPARSTTRSRSTVDTPPSTVSALLEAFDRCATTEDRASVGAKLATMGVRNARIRAAFVRMLDDDPLNGAAYLSAYGDRTAVADLSLTLDRLLARKIADCDDCAGEHVIAVLTAIGVLGGAPTDDQIERIESILDRAAEHWIPLDRHCGPGRQKRLH